MKHKERLNEYIERFKEQMKYQRLLINATKIFSETDAIALFRKLYKLCENSISCKAIAWFSDSLKLTPNNFKIKVPKDWPGWSQNSWDWLGYDFWKDDISSDDGKNDCFATCFPLDIESMGNSEAKRKTQKEYLLFVLKKAPRLCQDKSKEELLGALFKQFSMTRRIRWENFFSKRKIFRESLCQGSRTAVLEHGKDILRFTTELESAQKDFVTAVVVDAKIQLGIVSSQRPNFSLKAEELAKNETEKGQEHSEKGDSDPDQEILTGLVNLRKETWETRRKSKCVEEKLNRMKEYWVTAEVYCPPKEFQNEIEIKAKKAALEQELLSGLQEHYYERMGRVEFLRTRLFILYCSALGLEKVADTHNISNCERVCFDNIIGKKNLFSLLSEELSCFLAKWQNNKGSSLHITSEWLACWFGVRFLEDFPQKSFKKDYSPGERAIFFKHFAAYYLYLLHCIRNFGMPSLFRFSDVKGGHEDYLDAALFLLSEYAHQVCMLTRRIPLYRTLMQTWSSEAILYIVRPSYRDHLFHVLNVCLLGMVLMEAGLVDRLTESRMSKDEVSKNTMMNWILAGLLHDVGYCIDLNSHILSHTAFLRSSPDIRNFQENLQKNYTEIEKELIVSLNKEIKKFDCGNMKAKLDHGVVSARHFQYLDQVHLENKMGNAPNPGWMKQITNAFRAMVKHNLKDEVKIDPSNDPLSFLLLLCDHIQEWDRPRVDSLRLRRFVTSALQSPRSGSLDSSTIVRYLRADLSWNQKDKKMTPILSKDSLELSLHYKDSGDEQFEPALIWCQNSYDFEKVVLDNWPQNFHLVFKTIHPVSTKLRIEKKRGEEKEEKGDVVIEYAEMDLLQDYLRETEQEAFLATWISKSRKCDGWVKYHLAEKEKEEVFETVFEHTSNKHEKLILHLPPNFYRDYIKWKKQRLYDAELYCRS